ncbi:protein LAZ1-like [Raphanus sativus]|uniref:Protein LAZ1 n=1 Tax=Raphanus sativus TaxID=3726 RepID=A0A6J0MZ42_RAPSA|nr:protein LAZ1 [Raphanus sativus]XP_056855894.1 protein LAZ1-like [Raphanus sativus]
MVWVGVEGLVMEISSATTRLLSYSAPAWASLMAGAFLILTLSLSMYLVFDHLSTYKNPEEQMFLIGVILMVPFYSIESFASLVNPSISVDCGILRDCYESFAMYCFGRYLVACLGGEDRTIEFMQRQGRKSFKTPLLLDHHNDDKGSIKHPFPMNLFLKPWRLSHWFYQVVKFGIVQYMIIKSLTALTALILEAFGVYCEGEFKWSCGYPYLAVVLNFSQSWALYCLVQFYGATKDELSHINPLAKFLTFKSIVFMTWWQGVAIALLSSLGLFKSSIAHSLQLKTSVQDFIICIEMGIASVVHLYVFPAKPYGLLGDRFTGSVSVLGDYASVDCPIDPDEIRDSERRTKVRLPHPNVDIRSGMTIKESMRDVFVGGGEYIVKDVRFTVTQAVEPMEKSITKFNEKLHKISQNIKKHDKDKRRVKDDSCMSSSSSRRVIRGIDDPLLNGSFSDSGVTRTKKHRRKSGYTSAESGGESSSDQAYSGFEVRGRRWITKD